MDCKELDNIIFGRIKPHIYAFRTNTVPDYLKVGDTYRPVSVRLAEWKEYFKDLSKTFEAEASINDDVYFRDYSVHSYLELEKKKHRLTQEDLELISNGSEIKFSKEFFKDTSNQDIKEAIENINQNYKENTGKYQFYNSIDKESLGFTYQRSDEIWIPRPNQKEVIEHFTNARNNGRTNLLMYAVMRFGKSFTSLCCADEMNAKFVLVVSAKADVKNEWKQNVEIPANFKGYEFLDSTNIRELETKLNDRKTKCVVLFLTLQDLQGSEIKEHHKEVFRNTIDLLIVDETHYGARAESYGQVLRSAEGIDLKNQKKLEKQDKEIQIEDADKQLNTLLIEKKLKVAVKLHLSGTPYRILMGSEFQKEDIICFCQFSDIVNEKENWDKENLFNENNEKELNEWDNPYYGFPQMIRFAFNPNASSLHKINEDKKNGITTSFSALFTPKSINKSDDDSHKEFVHEKEVLDLLKVIDGSKDDDNILSFLDYDKIKTGKMCRHIVMVLPFCASCDAMESLIQKNKSTFKNLGSYEIVNISGVDSSSSYKTTDSVKAKISECEEKNIKTLTLTVNRMLTGSTVKQWDTMIFLKESSSPQEYDQAIFRLQNQYIKEFEDEKGDKIKFNMKPQTLLVDFDPTRMFRMQEKKALIYNVNTDESGNSKLEKRIAEELRISPIITANKDKIVQVIPNDILNAVREYSATRGIAEETNEIPVDLNLESVQEILEEINRQNEIDSKSGFTLKANKGEGSELDDDDENDDSSNVDDNTQSSTSQKDSKLNDETDESFAKKVKTYYARILFFAYLTEDNVISLEDVIKASDSEENKRIISNLSLNIEVLSLMQNKMDKWTLRQLDYKIQNINNLAKDKSVEPLQRAMTALKKFGRLSDSEVITPSNICDDMVSLLPDECLINAAKEGKGILDINSKTAEFAIAIYKRYVGKLAFKADSFQNNIYSIPSSKITYEFTRKIYKILGLSIDCIAANFVSYDLLKVKCTNKNGKETEQIDYERIKKILNQNKKFSDIKLNNEANGDNNMKFEAIVGNPPYQEKMNKTSDLPVYNYFYDAAFKLCDLVTLISPGRFLFNAGKTPKEWNEKMLNDEHLRVIWYTPRSLDIFPSVDLPGGIAIILRNEKQNYGKIGNYSVFSELNTILKKVYDDINFESISKIIFQQNKFNLERLYKDYPEYKNIIGSGVSIV